MGTAQVTLPDGTKAKITFNSKEQLDQTVSDLSKAHPKKDLSSPFTRLEDKFTNAVAEPALAIASGIAGQTAGGIAGLARGAGAGAAALASGEGLGKAREAFTNEAADTIQGVSGAATYQPKTPEGQAATRAISAPFTWLAGKADQAGQAVSDVTGFPALGALTNVAAQALPGALVPAARGLAGAVRRGVARAPEAGLGASGGAGTASEGVPRGTAAKPEGPGRPGEAPGAAQTPPPAESTPPGGSQNAGQPGPQAAPSPNEARAQAYARRIGLDWARLGAGTRAALTNIAQDSGALERLNPKAVERQAFLERQRVPIPATRGQLERDPVQLRREAIASRTSQGEPIRQVDIDANRAVQANLEAIRGRVAGKRGGLHDPTEEGAAELGPSIRADTKTPEEVGRSLTGELKKRFLASKANYDALYKKARATEPDAQAALAPVTALLIENPEIQHLGWVESWLNKAAKAKARREGTPEGEPVSMTHVTLGELADLRTLSQKYASGPNGHYAAELRKAIDAAMQDVPEGAAAWKEAIRAFQRHQETFKDQTAIRELTAKKRGSSDPATAPEQVWAKIAKGPVDRIRQVKETIFSAKTPKERFAARAAWRDLRGETVNRILEDARNVVATDETERQILTAAAFRKSLKAVPRANLEEILGKKTTQQLYDLYRASKITRTVPAARVTESGTVPNALIMAEHILKHVPLVGKIGAAGLRAGYERATAEGVARAATTSPLEAAAAETAKSPAARRARRAAVLQDLESGGPLLPGGTAAPQPAPIGQALPPKAPP